MTRTSHAFTRAVRAALAWGALWFPWFHPGGISLRPNSWVTDAGIRPGVRGHGQHPCALWMCEPSAWGRLVSRGFRPFAFLALVAFVALLHAVPVPVLQGRRSMPGSVVWAARWEVVQNPPRILCWGVAVRAYTSLLLRARSLRGRPLCRVRKQKNMSAGRRQSTFMLFANVLQRHINDTHNSYNFCSFMVPLHTGGHRDCPKPL